MMESVTVYRGILQGIHVGTVQIVKSLHQSLWPTLSEVIYIYIKYTVACIFNRQDELLL